MKLEHPFIGMVIRMCVFFNFAKKILFVVGHPAILVLKVTKRQTLLPNLLWVCLVSRLVYSVLILLTNIFFPFGKIIGMVRSRISFILSSQSWEIGSTLTGGAGRMKLSCVVPASVMHIRSIHLEERSSTSV